eukprot:Nitzschia sp. Nitz4//scaffold140_size61219//2180//3604//NITZ4_006429-RA/size61219-processed-gene-0.0-mRNA-1//1//CDS//3329536194//8471//frame0
MEGVAQQGSHADIYMNDMLLISSLTITALLSALFWRYSSNSSNTQGAFDPQAQHSTLSNRNDFPFVDVQSPIVTKKVSTEKALIYALDSYRKETTVRLHGLSQALQQALQLEQAVPPTVPLAVRLSTTIQNRIDKLSECLEMDQNMLMKLLRPFHPSLAVAAHTWSRERYTATTTADSPSPASGFSSSQEQENHNSMFHLVGATNGNRQQSGAVFENAYDEAVQVVAHLVRDWTKLGSQVRGSLYTWCTQQLKTYHSKTTFPVLVPGSGLGRLAFEIYRIGYTVEANELSPVMASAAAGILQRGFSGMVHPFILDELSNEVQTDRRYDQVPFPDVEVVTGSHPQGSSLSYTVGDFLGSYYGDTSLRESFGAVVTCFFIDTATDLYEYLKQIHRLLGPGGVWINVGPLQWHRNAMLFPSTDELRDLIEAYGFQIALWTIDKEPLHYRDNEVEEQGFVRTTNFAGYRPLRFVAIRK